MSTQSSLFDLSPTALVDDLTLPQRAAVEHRGSPLLVVAGAGSGKTRVLTRRIAHLLATGDAPPWGVLAITFTNKAAGEMRSRVAELVGPVGEKMWVSTFHSSCLRILRGHADRLGYRSAFTVYDDTDSRRLIEMIVAEMGLDTKRLPPRTVAAVIGQAKSELVDFESFRERARTEPDPFQRRIADVYAEYQQRLLAANAMDFDDLLMVTANLLQACDDVREAYQERFAHVLVDEFQDTNRAQNEIVELLAKKHGNVCVVGDSDQSVYKWRGADIRNILEFERAFPNATTIVLEQNFRSTQTILSAANAVIANNLGRPAKSLFTVGDAGRSGPALPGRGRAGRGVLGLRRDPAPAGGRGPVLGRCRRLLPHQRPEPGAGGLLHLSPASPTRWWAAPSSTTAKRSRTSWPTSGCWPIPMTRSRPGASSTCPSAASATPRWPAWPPGPRSTGSRSPRPSTGPKKPACRPRRSRGPSSCRRPWANCGRWCRP